MKRQIEKGTGFSFASEAEFALAELLRDRCDNFDKIRFMNSGTEAVMKSIKAARAYTGNLKIANCENSYHGSYDFAEVSLGVQPTDDYLEMLQGFCYQHDVVLIADEVIAFRDGMAGVHETECLG